MAAAAPQDLRLSVEIISAKGLRNADAGWSGVSDPYCICEVPGAPSTRVKTSVVKDSLAPVWNFATVMECTTRDALHFHVYDQDFGKTDDFLGSVELVAGDLTGILSRGAFEAHLPLEDTSRGKGPQGQLHVKIQKESAVSAGAAADLLGSFSIEELSREFETERQPGGGCESHPHVATRKEKRLKAIEKKFLDVRHMSVIEKPEYVLGLPYHKKVSSIVESLQFQYFYFLLVTIYSLVMGAELEFDDEKNDTNWFRLNVLFATMFMFEVCLKVYTYGHSYFYVRWYLLEFMTVGASWVSLGMYYKGYAESYKKTFIIMKCSRIVLLGKLFIIREEFQVIVLGFTRSVVQLWGVFFVLLVVCYGCTLFCYSVIGKHAYPKEHEEWHYMYFGSIPKIMMTLFSMIIVDEWAGFARPVYLVQPMVIFFFFFFTVMTTLGLLNVVTGMVVDTVNTVSSDHDAVIKVKEQAKQRQTLEDVVEAVFHAGNHHAITEQEFEKHDNTDELVEMIDTVDFPTSFTLKDLFTILDWPAHKEIFKEQFVDGVMNFIHGEQFQLDCQVILSINKVCRDIISMRKEMRVLHHKMSPADKQNGSRKRQVSGMSSVEEEPDLYTSSKGEAPRGDSSDPSSDTRNQREDSRIPRGDSSGGSGGSALSDETKDDKPMYQLESLDDDPAKPAKGGAGRDVSGHFGDFSIQGLGDEFESERLAQKGSSSLGALKRISSEKRPKRRIVGVEQMEELFQTPTYVKSLPFHRDIRRIVQSEKWKLAYGALVAVFSLMMGAELTLDDEKYEKNWFYMNGWFTMMFTAEVVCKLIAYGHNYFRVPWFVLEFATTCGSAFVLNMQYMDMSSDYKNAFTCLKLSRIILLGKLFSLRPEFEIIVLGFTRSLFNLWGIMFVLLVINYGCTLFCYSIIGKHDYSEYDEAAHELYWGSIPKTMITLFSMMITDNWGGYSRVVYEEQPPVIMFFYLYTIFLTMGLLNVVTGMVVDTVASVKAQSDLKEKEKVRLKEKVDLTELVELVFQDLADEITEDDFVRHASKGELLEMLEIVDVPHHFTLKDFFTVIDSGGHKKMSKEQFVEGIVTLINSTSFHRECQILLGVHKMRRGIVGLRKELSTMHHRQQLSLSRAATITDDGDGREVPSDASGMSISISSEPPQPQRRLSAAERELKQLQESNETKQHQQIDNMMMVQARNQRPTAQAVSAEKRFKLDKDKDHWEQLRSVIHAAAMEHCVDELHSAWQAMERQHTRDADPRRHKPGQFHPISGTGTQLAKLQEKWYIRHKLYSAVSRESLHDLRLALDHAQTVGISERTSAILFTFCDVLSRQQTHLNINPVDIIDALESGNWIHALDLVVEMSLKYGADKTMLLNALARLCADGSGLSVWQPDQSFRMDGKAVARGMPLAPTNGTTKLSANGVDMNILLDTRGKALKGIAVQPMTTEDVRGRLVAVLHSEAADHAARELTKAWQALDSAYRSADMVGANRGFGPGYSPFSNQEEMFFIRNQINDAVRQESLLELRRSITHAMAFGIEPREVEIEVAYRDALWKHQQGDGFSAQYVIEALKRADWWTALDDIIGASMARGADRHTLLKMIAKVVSPTAHLYISPAPRQGQDSVPTDTIAKYINAAGDPDMEAALGDYTGMDGDPEFDVERGSDRGSNARGSDRGSGSGNERGSLSAQLRDTFAQI